MLAQFSIPFEWLSIFVLAMTLAIVIKAYYDLLREFKKQSVNKEAIESEARKRAEEIVSMAQDQALRLMEKAKLETGEKETALARELHKLTEGQVGEYKLSLQNISKDIQEETLREFGKFKETLAAETIKTQESIQKRIEVEYEKMLRELSEARDKRYKDLEVEVVAAVREISKKVFGRAMSAEDHEQLIIQALEEAKKNHVF
jgi:F0F1-type ATP synthase membrane subunit b/b'